MAQAKVRWEREQTTPLVRVTVEVQKFRLDDVKDLVCTTQKVTIPPFSTVNVWANTSVRGHCMQVHVLTEPMLGPKLPAAVVPTATYRELCPGSSRVWVCLCNLSTYAVEIPAKTVVGQVAPANQIPPVVHLTRTAKETNTQASKGWVLEALDLQGLTEWPESEQEWLGSCCSNGNTCLHTVTWTWVKLLIKHKIQLTDQTPFKECYRHIPAHMYDNVRAHIQEMLDISAICKLHSPWASTVVLVWKKGWWPEVLHRPQETQ